MIKALLIFYFIFSISNAFSKDIPVIVISPGKNLQSKSSVGSDVEVISNKTLKNSNEYFIGDILDNNLNGINLFQSGGYGTVSGVQLRGQPKRYTTVYIDGVKVSIILGLPHQLGSSIKLNLFTTILLIRHKALSPSLPCCLPNPLIPSPP